MSRQQQGWALAAKLAAEVLGGDRGKAAEPGAQVVGAMSMLRHSREYEYEADAFGIRYMEMAGHNPWGMVELLTALAGMSVREPGRFERLFQTHPLPTGRMDNARQTVEREYPRHDRGRADPNAATFLTMKKRLTGALKK